MPKWAVPQFTEKPGECPIAGYALPYRNPAIDAIDQLPELSDEHVRISNSPPSLSYFPLSCRNQIW